MTYKNRNIKITGLFLCILLMFNFLNSCTTIPPKSVEKKPNIILIMTDDIGFETIGCYGSASYKTLRIDEMAEQGVKFE